MKKQTNEKIFFTIKQTFFPELIVTKPFVPTIIDIIKETASKTNVIVDYKQHSNNTVTVHYTTDMKTKEIIKKYMYFRFILEIRNRELFESLELSSFDIFETSSLTLRIDTLHNNMDTNKVLHNILYFSDLLKLLNVNIEKDSFIQNDTIYIDNISTETKEISATIDLLRYITMYTIMKNIEFEYQQQKIDDYMNLSITEKELNQKISVLKTIEDCLNIRTKKIRKYNIDTIKKLIFERFELLKELGLIA